MGRRRKDLKRKAAWDEQYKETNRIMSNFRHQELRNLFFDMYGDRCACQGCTETNRWFLTLDHINDDGNVARIKGKQSLHIYKDAVTEHRPDLYRVLCFKCNCGRDKNGGACPHFGTNQKVKSRKTNKTKIDIATQQQILERYERWSRTNGIQALARKFEVCAETIENIVRSDLIQVRKRRSVKARQRRIETKDRFLEMYGQVCACSGCNEANKGFLTLDHINNDGAAHRKKIGGLAIYRQAVNEFRPDLYQTLCFSCNCGKNRNNGVCPHIEITKEKVAKVTGSRNKLSPEAIRQIRHRYTQYSRTDGTRALAREFGVSITTVEDVVYNRSWKDI